MMPTFSATGDSAGRRKWRCAFRTPIATADSPTKNRYGNISRVIRTVSSPAAELAKKPGAMSRTSQGAARMPRRVRVPRTSSMAPATARSMRRVSARVRVVTYSVNTGMKADESAPSATRRRRRFGSRNATKKASVATPAPKARAITRSRRNPRIRLARVAEPTTAAARATARRAPVAGGDGGNSVSSAPIGSSALTGRPPSSGRDGPGGLGRTAPGVRRAGSRRPPIEGANLDSLGGAR